MARLTEQLKTQILSDFNTGRWSQRKLAEEHNVSLGTINKITKGLSPKNERIMNAQITVLEGKATLSKEEMNSIERTALDEVRRRNLVFNAQEKAVKKLNDMIDFTDAPQDMKHIVDSIDKASLTLGVNQRHSNSQVQVNNTNAIQNNVSVGLEDFYK